MSAQKLAASPESVDALASAFELAPHGAAVVELGGGRVLRVNDALCGILGRPRAKLERAMLAELAGCDDDALARVAAGEVGPCEARCLHADGRELALEVRGWPAGDAVVVELHDVTPSRARERALRESEKRLQDIVENVTAPIYVKDTQGRYLLINRHYEQLYGLRRAEVMGKTDRDLFPPDTAGRVLANDRRVLEALTVLEFEETAPALDGPHTFISLKFPLLDPDGRPYAMAGISTDITERKRVEAAVREAREEAERANRAKSEFLSRMSHELRTPLNSILGFGQLLQLEELPPGAGPRLERILVAGRHLLALINEVLDISRIEAGVQRMSLEPVHACDPLHEALELVRPLAEERDIEVTADLHRGLFQFVLADRQRLEQVLLNLLTNAVKYNRERGRVAVSFERIGDERLRFLIADTGPGIAATDAERVFMPFERLGADETGAEGTGLGLALSKSLVEAMGGTIGVERPADGAGTVMFVELTVTESPKDAHSLVVKPSGARRPDLATLAPGTILYIEDNLANFELVQDLLGPAKQIELIAAMQGRRGLELAARHRPRLILLDLHLPDLPGEDVLRQLSRDERTRDIPVIVLSADATPTQVERLRAAGATDYLTKPIDVPALLDLVRKTFTDSEAERKWS